MKKARAWLAGHSIDVTFHDFKKQGVDASWLKNVIEQTGWQALLNTRGTTWRTSPPAISTVVSHTRSTAGGNGPT